jgi:hypothetical protein
LIYLGKKKLGQARCKQDEKYSAREPQISVHRWKIMDRKTGDGLPKFSFYGQRRDEKNRVLIAVDINLGGVAFDEMSQRVGCEIKVCRYRP